jgi:uncharacterized membrane protein
VSLHLAVLFSHGTFLGLSGPEWHAALNDFPPALIIASVVFDIWGSAKSRESLIQAAYWCLIAGAGMAVLALVSGLLVEERIDQTPAVHRIVETHETLAIALTVVFAALATWRIWRKNLFSRAERQSYTIVALAGALATLWLAHLGGTMVYRHAAGISSDVLQAELRERADSGSRTSER